MPVHAPLCDMCWFLIPRRIRFQLEAFYKLPATAANAKKLEFWFNNIVAMIRRIRAAERQKLKNVTRRPRGPLTPFSDN